MNLQLPIIILLSLPSLTLGSVVGDVLSSLFLGLSHDPNDIRFNLHSNPSNPNSGQEIVFNDAQSLTSSAFQPNKTTVFLIHGYASNSSSHFPVIVRDAYVQSTLNYNYIVVGWALLAEPSSLLLYKVTYPEVVTKNIPIVAKRVADFVQFLQTNNYVPLNAIHLVGHSLGAHVAGLAGQLIQNANGGRKVARITGLDPAGPGFEMVEIQKKLTENDAAFVDIIHTAMGTRGDISVDGHVDFYANGGVTQPSCMYLDFSSTLNLLGDCSHQLVADIYAASITNALAACPCSVFIFDAISGTLPLCTLPKRGQVTCTAEVIAGEHCPTTTRGLYYFEWTKSSGQRNRNM